MLKLEKLPKQEIAAIKAVILENKKCVEAALELGMSVNTLKTHLARALKKLRKDYHPVSYTHLDVYKRQELSRLILSDSVTLQFAGVGMRILLPAWYPACFSFS